jgi:hypothetical protein
VAVMVNFVHLEIMTHALLIVRVEMGSFMVIVQDVALMLMVVKTVTVVKLILVPRTVQIIQDKPINHVKLVVLLVIVLLQPVVLAKLQNAVTPWDSIAWEFVVVRIR